MATLKNTTINDTGYLQLPTGTTAQRPVSASAGYMRWNTNENAVELYDGTQWENLKFEIPAIDEYLLVQARNEGIKVFQTSNYGFFTGSDLLTTTNYGSASEDSGIEVNADGTKIYYWEGGTVQQYTMTTPFDFNNASFEYSFEVHSGSVANSSYGTSATFFNRGKYAYASWGTFDPGRMDLYSFTTPYDWRTATFVREDSVPSNGTQGAGNIEFNPTGTRAYHGNRGGGLAGVFQFDLTTPFDLRTITNTQTISTQADVLGIRFSRSGLFCYTAHHSPDVLLRHVCTTPFDFTTSTESDTLLSDNAYNGAFITGPSYYE